MKRATIIWGISFVLIFLFISVVVLILPCKPVYFGGGFFGSACLGDLYFSLINLPGLFFIYLFYQSDQPLYNDIGIISISLLLNSVLYFLIGSLIGGFTNRKK